MLEPFATKALEAAIPLGMARVSLSRVINGRAGISPELALRRERTGASTARFWMAVQSSYELARAWSASSPRSSP